MKGFENDYDRRLEAVIARRTAPIDLVAKAARMSSQPTVNRYQASPIFEVYNKIGHEGSAVRYTVAAMARLDPKYTEATYDEAERIRSQLEKIYTSSNIRCDFEYQGSVTNDTHIKSYSDIDLLSITTRFTTLEPPQIPAIPYKGNPVKDLIEIREATVLGLKNAFPAAQLDDSGNKSVSIEGGSLHRKIDIVPANWFNTNAFANGGAKRFRAIQVLNRKTGERIKNMPFMHNYLIGQRDNCTFGGLRKIIRLMKSLRYDSEAISLSSYDLAAIGYSMPDDQLTTSPGGEIPLLARLKTYLDYLRVNRDFRKKLMVPDQSRPIFINGHATLDGLNELQDEVDDLVEAVRNNLEKSFQKLSEARLTY